MRTTPLFDFAWIPWPAFNGRGRVLFYRCSRRWW